MHSEQEAYSELIYQANREGLRGKKVIGFSIIHPRDGASEYTIVLSTKHSWDATEGY